MCCGVLQCVAVHRDDVMCRTRRNDIFEDHRAFSYIIFEDDLYMFVL